MRIKAKKKTRSFHSNSRTARTAVKASTKAAAATTTITTKATTAEATTTDAQ